MIEIKGFLETSFLDWPGKLCAVLFLPYCNFRCPYCHNHPLVLNPDQVPSIPLEEVMDRLHSFHGWIDGICVTGGEPTLHPDLPAFVRRLKQEGFAVKLDTNGTNPEVLEGLIERREVDAVSMDVKGPLDLFSYRRAVGVPVSLERILRSIRILKRGEVDYQFRLTVVPGLHREEDVRNLGHQLRAGRRIVLQNFNSESPLDSALKESPPYDQTLLKVLEREVQEMA